ncbi:hypothetical protein J421_1937 [Gemmatirosa kalamazoonensis]|uniref:Uncharacterized protein n=1 Tax=Gemmatirosa kalamazoonensis TaxID=861299 RepID=W0RED6_9BACT|nr:hypothetical protein [Gemmatirosa kalamazoonensis]AHG89474.1 hypothetical protein J421_1937 [Gemmatirosa kalamazoonensis]
MAAVASYLLLSLPALRVAVGGAAVAAVGVATGAASERWTWPAHGEASPRRRGRREVEQRRSGRRLRPRPVDRDSRWALAAADGCDVARCDAFLATVERWPRDVWLAIDRAAGEAPRACDAGRSVAALVSARGLHVTAWLVRDLVETSAAMAGGATPRHAWRASQAPGEHRVLTAAHEVVAQAALAHLLRPWLTADAYGALTKPVAVVPMRRSPNPYATP